MYVSNSPGRRSLAVLGLAAMLASVAGCQNRKIVARVNDAPINEEEYQDAVSRVRAQDFQQLGTQQVQTDAGGAGLITAVKDKLLEKLAADKHALPAPEEVKRFQEYLLRSNPNVLNSIAAGVLTKESLPNLIRDQIIRTNLGVNNDTVPETELQKEFKDNQKQYNFPEMVGVRAVPVKDETEGIQLINQINATGDFATAAAKVAPTVPNPGAVRYTILDPLPVETMAPAQKETLTILKNALAPLKDGQVAPAPIKLQPQGAPTPTFLVVQMVKRMPKGDATLADAREALRVRALAKSHPQMGSHADEVINEYNKNAKVDVYIDRYQDVVRQAMQPPNPLNMMGAPGGPGAPSMAPSGAPGSGRPMVIRPGAGAPSGAGAAPSGTRSSRPVPSSSTPSGAAGPGSATGSPKAGNTK